LVADRLISAKGRILPASKNEYDCLPNAPPKAVPPPSAT